MKVDGHSQTKILNLQEINGLFDAFKSECDRAGDNVKLRGVSDAVLSLTLFKKAMH